MSRRGIVTAIAASLLLAGCGGAGTEPIPTSSPASSASPSKTATARQWATIIAGLRGPLTASEGLLTGCDADLCSAGILGAEGNAQLVLRKINGMVADYGQPPEEVGALVGEANGLAQAVVDTAKKAKTFCPGAQCTRYAEDTRTAVAVLLSSFDQWAPYL